MRAGAGEWGQAVSTFHRIPVSNWRQDQLPASGAAIDDLIAAEVPIALTYNRVSHVVMMGTPADLEDFALGFSITEGLIGSPADLTGIRILPRQGGIELAMAIAPEWFDRLATQRRNMAGRTGCGLCGAENIEQALRFPTPVSSTISVRHAALQRAISALSRHQPLQADTGATHGAAWCSLDGKIMQLREDVGRHNAVDKLVCRRLLDDGLPLADTAMVVSGRASFEIMQKALIAGIPMVIAVGAPSSLAVELARQFARGPVGRT